MGHSNHTRGQYARFLWQSVKDEMVRLQIPEGNISTGGRGFADLLVQTGPGVREPQNRRAVIELNE